MSVLQLPAGLGNCLGTVADLESIVGAQTSLAASQTVCEYPSAAQTVFAPSKTVLESVQVPHWSGRRSGSLRLVPRQSWHRRRLSARLL
ncbi:hypothetical protein DPMN_128552 [Dreissena polymorpha]|uniref:Uncharacterized protein n=1 Tax=Dreissena polymorpha TaxID=45954 RepID=A0A9D4H129_DREPO|nr:hypothetical protein DPMN_128552 [Dreissena polymorpha]